MSHEDKNEKILDIIEKEYPNKYNRLMGNFSLLFKMFTREEWLTILTKSRASYEENPKPKKPEK